MRHPDGGGWHGGGPSATAGGEDPYADPARYDAEHADWSEDLAFYARHGASGRVMELGSGTGRVTRMLRAPEVVAVERSAAMCATLAERVGATVQIVQADFLHDLPRGPFDAILAPLNVLCHVAPTELRALLVALRHAAAPGCVFAADVYVDCPALADLDEGEEVVEVPWDGSPTRVRQQTSRDGSTLQTRTVWPDGHTVLRQHLIPAPDWATALAEAGWRVSTWGAQDGVEYDGGPKLFFVATPG